MRTRDKLLSDGEKINRSVLKGPSYLVVTANRLLLSAWQSSSDLTSTVGLGSIPTMVAIFPRPIFNFKI